MKFIIKFNFILYFFIFLLFCIDTAISSRLMPKNEQSNSLTRDDYTEETDFNELLDGNSLDFDYEYERRSVKFEKENIRTITESPIDTLIAIMRNPIQLMQTILMGNETSKHAKEISDIIGYNIKKIIKKFFRIANEALDNFNTINNAGLVNAIVQLANFMTKINQFVSPSEWQTFIKLDLINNIRLPLNLRSPNANHEQIFDVDDLL